MARFLCCTICFVVIVTFFNSEASAQLRRKRVSEPGWTSKVIKRGTDRTISKNTPIELRPYRPLHFYGNTVRRRHYRGNPLPMPRDILRTGIELLR